MQTFASIIDSIAWPIAIVWLGYLFRSDVRSLLSRISELRYKNLAAKFDQSLDQIEREAEEALLTKKTPSTSDEEPAYPQPYDEKYAELLRIADSSPIAALVEAWIVVEGSLAEAAERFGVKSHPRQSKSKTVISLINTGHYAKTILPLFDDLRGLRNEAAHATNFEPNRRQIRRYIQLAIELALTFQNPLYVDA